ncbi:MAG: CBS domain-containing protein [Peptococcaceae bacterium]|jgi:CBS domain-containing protein|nr:CBS domain-containing protein [Peptococcaceae bacterium]
MMDYRSNILFFLTPKDEVAYIYEDSNFGETMEKMELFRYTSIPVLKRSGEYLGTITEGDLLWGLKNKYQFDYKKAKGAEISQLPRHADNLAVTISTDIDDLIAKALDQNFVPVEDDRGMFIGIITRRHVIQYFKGKMEQSLRDFHIA